MAVKIIVLSDGGTWEEIDSSYPPMILEVSQEGYEELLAGSEPRHLEKSHIISAKSVKGV